MFLVEFQHAGRRNDVDRRDVIPDAAHPVEVDAARRQPAGVLASLAVRSVQDGNPVCRGTGQPKYLQALSDRRGRPPVQDVVRDGTAARIRGETQHEASSASTRLSRARAALGRRAAAREDRGRQEGQGPADRPLPHAPKCTDVAVRLRRAEIGVDLGDDGVGGVGVGGPLPSEHAALDGYTQLAQRSTTSHPRDTLGERSGF